jgi:hypothetical protein
MICEGELLSSGAVMARFGYKSRSSFWAFVTAKGVPHIKFNGRKIMFDPAALAEWEAKRTVGGRTTPRPPRGA